MNTLVRRNSNFPSLIENFFGRDMNDFFNTNMPSVHNVPAVNVAENKDGFRIEVAAPGLKKDDFKLDLNHNNLTISAYQETHKDEADGEKENQNTNQERYTRREFSYSSFQRTFTLPTSVDADKIHASYTDGLLKIELPKREEAKVKPPRQIEINA
ncbi:Hsp20/alpha crystallin family protein [Spirosoma harenae]